MGNTHKEPGIESRIWPRKERTEGEEDKGDHTKKRQQQKGRNGHFPLSLCTGQSWETGAGIKIHLDKKAQGRAGREFCCSLRSNNIQLMLSKRAGPGLGQWDSPGDLSLPCSTPPSLPDGNKAQLFPSALDSASTEQPLDFRAAQGSGGLDWDLGCAQEKGGPSGIKATSSLFTGRPQHTWNGFLEGNSLYAALSEDGTRSESHQETAGEVTQRAPSQGKQAQPSPREGFPSLGEFLFPEDLFEQGTWTLGLPSTESHKSN